MRTSSSLTGRTRSRRSNRRSYSSCRLLIVLVLVLVIGLSPCNLAALDIPEPTCNENKILVTLRITEYAFSRTAPRKRGPFGAVELKPQGKVSVLGHSRKYA